MFNKLKQTLTRTSNSISQGIDYIFFQKKADESTLSELEELLIAADIDYTVVEQLINNIRAVKFESNVSSTVIKEQLSALITGILSNSSHKLVCSSSELNVILVCGVNGSGKTTTIGKLANHFKLTGKAVSIAACDTFRAAALEQLATWSYRTNSRLIVGTDGADPASVAFKAVQQCMHDNTDVLLIDTAGRLHNYQNLMSELEKIIRVIKKINPIFPQYSILVIDGSTGQNAHQQVTAFKAIANITGLIFTKLDGTAKAGTIVSITQKFALPIYYLGFGEQINDLECFYPATFAQSIVGL